MELVLTYSTLKTHIELSKQRRPVYYKKKDKIPKKFNNLTFDKKGFLIDVSGNKVLKNSVSVGKPKYIKLNFNAMWSGKIHYIVRSKIKLELHQYFDSHSSVVKCFDKSDKLKIDYIFFRPLSEKQDIDNNSFFYIKAFPDYLQEHKIINNDSQVKEFSVKLIDSEIASLKIIISTL